jgi:hypothetical protein
VVKIMIRIEMAVLPSDWGGITILDYDPSGTLEDLPSRLGAAVHSIRKEINRLKTK